MPDDPLSRDQAKAKLNWCLEEGSVNYMKHFRDEMIDDNLTTDDIMTQSKTHECTGCGQPLTPALRSYRYTESGLSNVILQGVKIADCPACGNSDVIIPRMAKIHRAIAQALAKSPTRLTGEQLRFLRNHLGRSGQELARYLHTDKTKISKWERGEDRIGPATDRLIRLLATALDSELSRSILSVAEHLPQISDDTSKSWEMHIDIANLQVSFLTVPIAA